MFNLDEASPGLNFPPMHQHCRSTTIPYVTDVEDRTRIARDSRGKNIYVDSDMNYDEFHKKYVESDPEYSFKEKAWRNRHSDRKQFEKYKKVGVNLPESFDEYQYMKYNGSERDRHLRAVDYSRRMKFIENPELALPNVDTATIDNNKFEKYLFGGDNEKGLNKGRLIEEKLGYNIDNYKDFEKEILSRARYYPAIYKDEITQGKRYEQQIIFYNVNKEPINAVVAWLVDNDKTHVTTIYVTEVKWHENKTI